MATIKLKGNPINTIGSLPETGTMAPDFTLTAKDLSDHNIKDFLGKKIILNIFPSIDTAVCAMSVRRFNQELSALDSTIVLCISRDLPFAMGRFCAAEGLERVITLSEMRDDKFGRIYGLRIMDGPMAGLLARSVVVINPQGQIAYTELVPDIVLEPDYAQAIAAVKKI
ncbi:MAG: thiol peroxidase [Candidatus Cloacimonetes bacterium]|nr:thiol peroxidase [Candidatus Cloacimonadota bacterium]